MGSEPWLDCGADDAGDQERAARIRDLKRAIEDGTYDVDGQLADLLERMRGRLGPADED